MVTLEQVIQSTGKIVAGSILFGSLIFAGHNALRIPEARGQEIIYTLPNQQSIDTLMRAVKWDDVKKWSNSDEKNRTRIYNSLTTMGYRFCKQQFIEWTDFKIENGELLRIDIRQKGPGEYIVGIAYSDKFSSKVEKGCAVTTPYNILAVRATGPRIEGIRELLRIAEELSTIQTTKQTRPPATPITPATKIPAAVEKTVYVTPSQTPAPTVTITVTPKETPKPTPTTEKTVYITPASPTPKDSPTTIETKTPPTEKTKAITPHIPEVRLVVGDPRKGYVTPIIGNKADLFAEKTGNIDTYICILVRDTRDDKNSMNVLFSDAANNHFTQKWNIGFELEYSPKQLDEIIKKETKGKLSYNDFKQNLFLPDLNNEENMSYRLAVLSLKTKLPQHEVTYVVERSGFLGIGIVTRTKIRNEFFPIRTQLGYDVKDEEGNIVTNYSYSGLGGFAEINITPPKVVYCPSAGGDPSNLLLHILSYIFLHNDITSAHGTTGIGPGIGGAGGGFTAPPGPGTGP